MRPALKLLLVFTVFAGVVPPRPLGVCQGADGATPPGLQAIDAVQPASPAPPERLPLPTPIPDRPPAFVLPPPPPDYATPSERWIGSPLLERAEAAPPGLFGNVESSVVWIHLRNQLQGGFSPQFAVGLPPSGGMPITGDIVSFPGNSLNPTVTPRFELGYRFPDGFGELRLGYRFMDALGHDTLVTTQRPDTFSTGDLGPASQKGRLAVNFIDFDFGTRQFSLGPDWELRTAVGMRYATAFFDSEVTFLRPVTVRESPFGTGPFTRLYQSETVHNRYFGAHGVLEVGRNLCIPGLTLFGRLEGCGLYGRVHQKFIETFVEPPGSTQIRVTNGVGCPTLAAQAGLSYDVPNWNHCRFMIGYQYEMWWQFGRGDNDLSFGTLDDQGVFLRAEFNF
jgi:hypothetical protein